MNIKKEELLETMQKHQVSETQAQAILEDLKNAQKEAAAGEKTEYRQVGLVLSGGEFDSLPITERPIFFTKIEAESDHNEIPLLLSKVKEEYNKTKKGRKQPAETIGDLLSFAPRKIFKEVGVKMPGQEPMTLVEIGKNL